VNNGTDILIYQTEDGNTKIDVRFENETVWMTQKAIAELYQKGVNTINEHIKNIYAEGELQESSTIRKNRIVKRADAEKENMGLTSWKGDKVRKRDVTVAKNYLSEKELKSLNRIVTMYLDYAEDQAERQRPMYMKDWIDKLNAFLQFNERDILENAGKVSKVVADKIATQEYEKFNQHRIEQSSNDDFDKFIENNNLKK